MLIPRPCALVIQPEEQRAHNRGQKAAWKEEEPSLPFKSLAAPGLAAMEGCGLKPGSEGRRGGGNTRQKSRGKEKRRDFYKTHPSPNPGPRRDTDTYRLTVPTYNPTTTMDPLRAKKRKKKGVTGRGRGQKRAVHLRRGGNERKSGNDESIVPVQRLFSRAFEAASPSSPPSRPPVLRPLVDLPPSHLFLCPTPFRPSRKPRHVYVTLTDYSKRRVGCTRMAN